MKKLIILLLACVLVFTACSESEPKEPIPEEETKVENLETPTSAVDIDKNTAKQLIKNEITVDFFGDNENVTVSEIGYFGTPSKYAVADLDEDGARELIVEISPSGDRIIIDVTESGSTAYYFPIRSYNDVKNDGTAGWSASAFENGIHKVKFINGDTVFEDLILHNTNDGIFKVNGKDVTEEECNKVLALQHEKESVEWLDIE